MTAGLRHLRHPTGVAPLVIERKPLVSLPTVFAPNTLLATWLVLRPALVSLVVVETIRRPLSDYMQILVLGNTKLLNQITGVDSDWATFSTQASCRAGINALIFEGFLARSLLFLHPAGARRRVVTHGTARYVGVEIGVKVRDGQTGSQKPHSIQRSTKVAASSRHWLQIGDV